MVKIVNGFHLFPKKFHHRYLTSVHFQNHLGIILDYRLAFNDHLENVSTKIDGVIAIIRKLQYLLPRAAVITMQKLYFRPHADYGDVIYEQA